MKRNAFLRACGAAALAVASSLVSVQAWAQGEWPTKPIRIVVPYPPGTGPDVMARKVGQGLSKEFGTAVVVENKPGANGIIGTSEVVKSAADGYTYLLVDRLTLTVNPLLYQPPYNPKTDLVSVSNIADVYLYLVTTPQLPATDFKSFIAYAKANPGGVAFGTGGVGSIMHLNMELLEASAGVKFLHVPFKALAEVIPAMLGDRVQATSGGIEAVLPFVKDGKLRLLAVGAPARQPLAPTVPTITEVAGSDMLLSTSFSLHAKAGTPPQILSRMHTALTKVLADPELKEWTAARGLRAEASTPAELDASIASDNVRIGRLVRERGIKVQ